MRRRVLIQTWSSLTLLVLQGCFVSFNDYPLGDTGGGAAANGGTASSAGGTASNGGGGSGAVAGTDSAPIAGSEATGDGGQQGSEPSVPSLIDNFEDNDPYIAKQDGRNGAWYVSNDGTGNQTPRLGTPVLPTPIQPPRAGSKRALHTFGGPFTDWGALVGTSLVLNGSTAAPYDLSRYTGIALWARVGTGSSGPGPGAVVMSVRVNLPSTETNVGGDCTMCNDHFGFDVPLTTEWQRFERPFSELAQSGFGTPAAAPHLEHTTAIQFFYAKGQRFDLWVDDIELY